MDLMSLTAVELGRKIKAKEVTVTEAVTAALDAIEKKEKAVHSFVTVDETGCVRACERSTETDRCGNLNGTACRSSGCGQGQYVHKGSAHNLLFKDLI